MHKYKNFILDVDGVFTDGKFHYTSEGKTFKTFGDADSDALSLIKKERADVKIKNLVLILL